MQEHREKALAFIQVRRAEQHPDRMAQEQRAEQDAGQEGTDGPTAPDKRNAGENAGKDDQTERSNVQLSE